MSKITLTGDNIILDKSKTLSGQQCVNYSRNERVENIEKQQIENYVERHHEDVGTQLNNGIYRLDPGKILNENMESKTAKVHLVRSGNKSYQETPIGFLPNAKFENPELQRILSVPDNVRKPKSSPASRYFKTPTVANTKKFTRKIKKGKSQRSKYTPRRPIRPNGYVSGRPLPVRAQQQYTGYLNGSEIFRTNSPRSKFLRHLHQTVSRKYPELATPRNSNEIFDKGDVVNNLDDETNSETSTSSYSSSIDIDEDLATRISIAFQQRFGITDIKVSPNLHKLPTQETIAEYDAFASKSNNKMEINTTKQSKKSSRRRRKKRKKKRKGNIKQSLQSMRIYVQQPNKSTENKELISQEEIAYSYCHTRKSVTRISMKSGQFVSAMKNIKSKSHKNNSSNDDNEKIFDKNYVVQAMSTKSTNVNKGDAKITSDSSNISIQDDNFHVFESVLRYDGGDFFMDEGKVPKELISLLYGASTYISLSKNTKLQIGKNGEDAMYVICEGHLKAENSQELLDDHIVIGTEILFKDDINVVPYNVVSAEIKAIQLKRENFQAVLIAYYKSKNLLEKFTSSYAFAPLLPEYNEELNKLSVEDRYTENSIIINQGKIPGNGYILLEGSVQVIRRDRSSNAKNGSIVQTYTKGESFGFYEMFATDKESSKIVGDVVCVNEVVVKKISEGSLQKLTWKTLLQKLMFHLSKVELLSRLSLMKQFSMIDLSPFAISTYYQFFKRGKKIVKEGDVGSHMYIIKYGEVSFTKSFVNHNKSTQVDIGHLFKNEFFGEGTVVSKNSTRRATGVADIDTLCLVLPGSDTKRLFGTSLQTTLGRIFLERQQADLDTDGSTIKANDLFPIRLLGEGSYGKVIYVRNSTTGKSYALKQIKKASIRNEDDTKHVLREKDILSKLNPHPFICNLIRTFKNDEFVYFLMDAVLGGELFSYMQKVGLVGKKDIVFYCAQIVVILDYLHSNEIVFRDLKPENLLITNTGYLKLVDFGLSKVLPDGIKTFTMCGTPTHMAPEIYAGKGHDKSVDWWSFGVLVHEFIYGHVPFIASTPQDIYSSILSYSSSYDTHKFPPTVSNDVSSFIKRLLNPNPEHRLGVKDSDTKSNPIFSDNFFGGNFSWVDLMKSMMRPKYVPKVIDSYDTSNFGCETSSGNNNTFTNKEALGFNQPISNGDEIVEINLQNKQSSWWKDF